MATWQNLRSWVTTPMTLRATWPSASQQTRLPRASNCWQEPRKPLCMFRPLIGPSCSLMKHLLCVWHREELLRDCLAGGVPISRAPIIVSPKSRRIPYANYGMSLQKCLLGVDIMRAEDLRMGNLSAVGGGGHSRQKGDK